MYAKSNAKNWRLARRGVAQSVQAPASLSCHFCHFSTPNGFHPQAHHSIGARPLLSCQFVPTVCRETCRDKRVSEQSRGAQ